MKILIIVSSLTEGGAERVATSYANGLSKLGHQVFVLSNPVGQTYPLDENVTLIANKYKAPRTGSLVKKVVGKGKEIFNDFSQIKSIFSQISPDVVINVQNVSCLAFLTAKVFASKKFPIISSDHSPNERPNGTKFKFKIWRNKFILNRLFDGVTVLTKRDEEILLKKGFPHVDVLNNPLFLEPVPVVPEKEKVILAVGRINVWHCKGFDLLIKAWDKIAGRYPEWKLRIVGKGSSSSLDYLKGLIHQSADQIEFAPFTKNIVEEYRNASIFVLSSRYEGWGLVMVEAMSQGCAVIACDCMGRQAEVVTDGENGLLCESGNYEEIARKISLLIENPELRSSLQQNAIHAVDNYQEEKVARRLEKILEKYVESPKK